MLQVQDQVALSGQGLVLCHDTVENITWWEHAQKDVREQAKEPKSL